MPNCIFQFKQFAVWSHIGGFKVGTDAVLLGAWINIAKDSSVLEIGTGTGVVSLMIAQRHNASISAIEIDPNAAAQAHFNFQRSKFGGLSIENASVQKFANTKEKFDCIVCNPPYFQFSSKPDSETLHKAKHTDSLCPTELLECSARLITDNGNLCMIIPFSDMNEWIDSAKSSGFYLTKKLLVRPAPEFDPKRVLLEFGRVKESCQEQEMIIEQDVRDNRSYTTQFQEMMKDYFIRF